ncbi:MAG: 23S rRNA (adenine(2503)-C(2))-methyltransferase RlmN [Bacillota bacterium]
MNKVKDIKGLTRQELEEWLEDEGFNRFRGQQVFNWLYRNGVKNPEDMQNLPGTLIEYLRKKGRWLNLTLKNRLRAADGTIKYLWQLTDNNTVESVYLPDDDYGRRSVCISSQVGCNMGCKFCATGLNGLQRNLTTGEIIDQILSIQSDISQGKFGDPALTNVVFMGMGEPLANLDNLLKAVEIINDSRGLNIGMRRMTISTVGIIPGIKKLAHHNPQIGLAVSLNAPNDRLRNQLMPVNKKYPLASLLEVIENYIGQTHRRVTFEYVLIRDINDKPYHADQLVKLLKGLNCHVNLIPLNPIGDLPYERPGEETIRRFQGILTDEGITATLRRERGTNIEAACGQLRRAKGGVE